MLPSQILFDLNISHTQNHVAHPKGKVRQAARRKASRNLTDKDWKNIKAVAKRAVGNAGIRRDERPDIEQELATALWLESRKFSKRQSSWNSFSFLVLEKHLQKIIRARSQPSARYCNSQALSLNTPVPDSDDSDVVSEIIDQINSDGLLEDGTSPSEYGEISLKIDMDEFTAALPEDLREICDLLKTMSICDAASILGISRTTLYSKIKAIKKGMLACDFCSLF